jgi:tetratricopeptide (TPR) repeat protein
MGTLINRYHIVSFLLIASLYILVAGWKLTSGSGSDTEHATIMDDPARQEIARFWEVYNEATMHRVHGDYKQAVRTYSEALSINSKHEDALYYLGNMHLFLKNFEESESSLLKLEELNPNSPRTQLQLGTLYSCLDIGNNLYNLDAAYRRFRTAWNLNREETGAPLMLSKIYLLKDDADSASELIGDITLSNKMSYQALFLQGYVEWKAGDEGQAIATAADAMNLYQSLAYADVHGEGATEAGARAMLSDDRYCDPFESEITALLSAGFTHNGDNIFEDFERKLKAWRFLPGNTINN